jgi:hypothetical protein
MFSRASVKLEENKMESIVDGEPKTVPRSERREGAVARTIEQQTAKLPSDTVGRYRVDCRLLNVDDNGTRKEGELRGAMGANLPDSGLVQQDGEAARIRRTLDS